MDPDSKHPDPDAYFLLKPNLYPDPDPGFDDRKVKQVIYEEIALH